MNETTIIERPRARWKWAAAVSAVASVLVVLLAFFPGGGHIEIVADEYSFKRVPERLDAGEHRFQLRNEGHEPHEMVFVRLAEGIDSVEELLALPEDQAGDKVEVVGVAQAEPGEKSSKVTVKLQPGKYALLCFIPTGGSGPPHSAAGMTAEINVT